MLVASALRFLVLCCLVFFFFFSPLLEVLVLDVAFPVLVFRWGVEGSAWLLVFSISSSSSSAHRSEVDLTRGAEVGSEEGARKGSVSLGMLLVSLPAGSLICTDSIF